MTLNRRKAIGLLAVAGAGTAAVIAQTPTNSPPAPGAGRSPDDELQLARAGRLRDAQRIASVKLPPFTEPAFLFRP